MFVWPANKVMVTDGNNNGDASPWLDSKYVLRLGTIMGETVRIRRYRKQSSDKLQKERGNI